MLSQFKENINDGNPRSNLFLFGISGVITTVRLPLTFLGVNQFDSNVGGCININNAKVNMNGTMNFTNNKGALLGGAIRMVGLVLVSIYMNTLMSLVGNILCTGSVAS